MKKLLLLLSTPFVCAQLSLFVITHPSCPVCQKWHNEIEETYLEESLTRDLPSLQSFDLSVKEDRDFVSDKIGLVFYIPMFVLMDGDTKLGSFDGYTDFDEFFTALDELCHDAPRDGFEPPTK